MINKKCNNCLVIKNVSEFGIEKNSINGYKPRCKKCVNADYNKRYKDGKINKKEYSKKYYHENKEVVLKKINKYYKENSKKIILRQKFYLRRKKIEYPYLTKLASFRTLIKKMLKDEKYSTFKYLGYSFDDLIKSLGRLPNDNEDIDHKIPISWFEKETELKLIFHLDNLHLLSSYENRVKGNRFCHPISKKYYTLIKTKIKNQHLKKITYE
jgi:hypothetical protein